TQRSERVAHPPDRPDERADDAAEAAPDEAGAAASQAAEPTPELADALAVQATDSAPETDPLPETDPTRECVEEGAAVPAAAVATEESAALASELGEVPCEPAL